MANFTVFESTRNQQILTDREYGVVGLGATLAVIEDAVVALGRSDITALGAIHSFDDDGIGHRGTSLFVTVGQQGSITSSDSRAIETDISSSFFLDNAGYLSAVRAAISADPLDDAIFVQITNTGIINSDNGSVMRIDVGDGNSQIINSGKFVGASGIYNVQGEMDFVNSGTVTTNSGPNDLDNAAYSGSGQRDHIENSGLIDGLVQTHGGSDTIRNSGALTEVDLGNGNDRYFGRHGTVRDEVHGRGGDDRLRGGNQADSFLGGGGDDDLRGRQGDDELEGNSGRDTLNGGRGDDDLRGGENSDIFVFSRKHGFDTIRDFGDGNDVLDVSDLGLNGFNASIRDNLVEARRGTILDLERDHGLTIYLRGVDPDELSSQDFAF